MRIKLIVLAVLLCGATLFFMVQPSQTQTPSIVPINREQVKAQPAPSPAPVSIPVISGADQRFLKLDRDGDGLLSFNEMTENLRVEKDKWDSNGDGYIDLAEWNAYIDAVMAQRAASNVGQEPPIQEPNRQPRNPTATPSLNEPPTPKSSSRPPFRENTQQQPSTESTEKYPKNMVAWFKEYDTDNDGQVGLYEWKAKGDVLSEFKKYDLNDDGFITLEELIRSGQFLANTKAPPTLQGLQAEVGDFFFFEITGAARGIVWGTDVYTADSSLAVAAVHAGVLKVGQKGLVKVIILAGQQSYEGSERNEVTTQTFGVFPKSFKVEVAK